MTTNAWSPWNWPFFDESHRDLARRVVAWNAANQPGDGHDQAAECRRIVSSLGNAGLLKYVVPEPGVALDLRAMCLVREGLTYHDALADSLFAMQGIGTLAVQTSGTPAQRSEYLQSCRSGARIAAFALSELDAGTDIASLTTTATRAADEYIINGTKTLVTNAGFADHYLVIARTGEAAGSRGLSAFIVDAQTPGLSIGSPTEFMSVHPAAPVTFADCRVPATNMIGAAGQGFAMAVAAFDIVRPSVGAAAVGLARRALQETLLRVSTRRFAGQPMSALQTIQSTLADMVTDIETAALCVYSAAWEYDVGSAKRSYSPSMAKLHGTEAAGRVVDRAVQIFGGAGVTRGHVIEHLYRQARPMRIYEGASEIQKLTIGRHLIKEFAAAS